ncbi:reduced folate transporter isoform X2 [Choloepus didactylus]|nr:reduced folate transporter isoform X2 [Choloepus didactylus]
MVPSCPVVEKQAPADPDVGRELQSWRCLVFYICFYGFVAQLRPGESFITPYLLGPYKNFTRQQVTNEITPVLSYSYLVVLVPVFLLTDYLRYKPVLVLQALSYVAVWLLLLLGRSVPELQLMEFFYSVTMAARIAYSSYIFSLVRPARYQRMAGCSRAAVLLGVFTSSVLGQLLVSVGRVSFPALNQASLALLVCSLLLSLFLRRPQRSLFFHRGAAASELDRMRPGRPEDAGLAQRLLRACGGCTLGRMLRELGGCARRPQLRLWSLWWVFCSAGYYLIVYYVHILWSVVQPTNDTAAVYNGGADAASTGLSAFMSFVAGFVHIRWALWSPLVIAGVTALQAGLVLLMYSTSSIWVCYASFVLFRGFYQFLVPIATFQIASSLSKELCALVFGVNTFLATVLKTTITAIISDKHGLGLPVHSQFLVYFGYFLLLSVAYLLGGVLVGLRHCQRGRHQPLALAPELQSPSVEKPVQMLSLPNGPCGVLPPTAGTSPTDQGRWAPGSLGEQSLRLKEKA